jgi:hypothetical protein
MDLGEKKKCVKKKDINQQPRPEARPQAGALRAEGMLFW